MAIFSSFAWSRMAAEQQKYRCIVDGSDEFRGEKLPTGTETEVLGWIKARCKVLGEVLVIDNDAPRVNFILTMLHPSLWPHDDTPREKRYLVEAAGAEKVFILHPIPDGLLTAKPIPQLKWKKLAEHIRQQDDHKCACGEQAAPVLSQCAP